MDDTIQPLKGMLNNSIEVVVHVKEDLGEEQRGKVIASLENKEGILGVEFCPLRNHLVLAKYDKDIFSSQQILKSFHALNLDARLIGPI
jgi:hypothetical protein